MCLCPPDRVILFSLLTVASSKPPPLSKSSFWKQKDYKLHIGNICFIIVSYQLAHDPSVMGMIVR